MKQLTYDDSRLDRATLYVEYRETNATLMIQVDGEAIASATGERMPVRFEAPLANVPTGSYESLMNIKQNLKDLMKWLSKKFNQKAIDYANSTLPELED